METIAGFQLTEHAKQRMKERKIKKSTVESILSKGAVKPHFHGKRVVYSNGTVRVVVNLKDTSITTVYWIGPQAKRNGTYGKSKKG